MNSVKFVPGRGNNKYPVFMFIGEAPGEQEDLEGKPFVGRSGKLVDKWLNTFSIHDYYITNAVKVRPSENRTPTFEELMSWRPYLLEEIRTVHPDIIMTLGLSAAKALTADEHTTMKTIRGDIKLIKNMPYTFIATYHPAYILRTPAAQEEVNKDFDSALDFVNEYKDMRNMF